MSQKTSRPSAAKQLADEAVAEAAESPRQVNVLNRLLRRESQDESVPTPPTPRTPPTSRTLPTSPERDFTKVANSIVRDVVPSGHFVGKSKQLYDYLYQRTRGGIVPNRFIAMSKPELMRGSDIGSERTLLKNLNHLKTLGLVAVTYTDGKHEGNTYEVFLPEEVGLPNLRTPPTPRTPRHARAEVPPVPPVESGVRGVGSNSLESTTSSLPKTSFKTKEENDDDEAAPRALRKAERELTGRESSAEQWQQLFEILATELRIAAARTTVSSVPAFLTEHLRRRLWKRETGQGPGAENIVQVKSEPGIDVSKCPDCGGTGWWYPNGFEAGVAKCKHEKIGAGR